MDVVLCHEDALVTDVIRASLEDQGFDVALAASLDEVREMAREPITCVVGYELLMGVTDIRGHLVGEVSSIDEQRVIVLASRHADTVEALKRGADACLGPSEGLERLVRLLRRDRDAGAGLQAARARVPFREGTGSAKTDLTPRETEVLARLVRGESTKKLAAHLGVSPATARTHVQNVLVKLGVHSRLEAVAFAVENQIVPRSMLDDSEDSSGEATA